MRPINFKESNRHLGKPAGMTDEECGSLHVFTDGSQCISCWKMSWRERLSALLFGRVWVSVLSGGTQPPIWAGCQKTVFKKKEEEKA